MKKHEYSEVTVSVAFNYGDMVCSIADPNYVGVVVGFLLTESVQYFIRWGPMEDGIFCDACELVEFGKEDASPN